MRFDIVPANLWRFPSFASDMLEDLEEALPTYGTLNGLSVSEDEKQVYVETAVPGLDPKDIDVTFEKGMLWIKGQAKEEEKKKKYYRKATSSFSYRIAIPETVDWKAEPEAVCKHGVMHITFIKSAKTEPKKIAIKTASEEKKT